MKTIVTCLLLSLATEVMAQKKGEKPQLKAPTAVINVFAKENPDQEVRWKRQDTAYRAEFIDERNLPHVRVYDRQGRMIYREDVVDSAPAPIQSFYGSKYPGEGFITWSRIDSDGTLRYYTYRNADTLWFDKDGKFKDPGKGTRRTDSISVINGPAD